MRTSSISGSATPTFRSAPQVVDKLVEAAQNPRNHRYSVSRGLPNLRKAAADRYRRRFGVEIDPETEVIATIGAKEGPVASDVGPLAAGRRGGRP